MFKILFVIPYNAITKEVEDVLRKYRSKEILIDTVNAIGVEETTALNIELYDLVVARGISYATLTRENPHKPIIEIGVTGVDLIAAISEAKRFYSPKRVAVVGWRDMINPVRELGYLSDIDIHCFDVESDLEAQRVVNKLGNEGFDVVVGGLMSYKSAKALGMKAIYIKTSKEAIERAAIEALNTTKAILQESQKAKLFKIIMDYTREAILAVDNEGNITTINKVAKYILKIPSHEKVVGKNISTIMPDHNLLEIMQQNKQEINKVEKYRDTLLNTNSVCLEVKGEIKGAVKTFQKVSKIQEMEKEIRKTLHKKGLVAKYQFKDIIGSSKTIKNTISIAHKYSQVKSNILLIGETGTGKELFAQSIHNASENKEGPFVAINCAALPENLLESELFGYVEGAFTGAIKGGKIGFFELAHTGTLFLDEINEVSITLQSKLLRVLEEKEIRRVGDDRVIPINVRIITATNANLFEKIEAGEFRRDLLYRLNVLDLRIPSLRERAEDIGILAAHYIEQFSKSLERNITSIDDACKEKFLEYDWPGNIRELRNICERLVVLNDTGVIRAQDFMASVYHTVEMVDVIKREQNMGKQKETQEIAFKIEDVELSTMLDVLQKVGNNKSYAAKVLGISRTTLWRKLKEYGIED